MELRDFVSDFSCFLNENARKHSEASRVAFLDGDIAEATYQQSLANASTSAIGLLTGYHLQKIAKSSSYS